MNDVEAVLSDKPISRSPKMAAYEALWAHQKATCETIADCFRGSPNAPPSELVSEDEIDAALLWVRNKIAQVQIHDVGGRVHGSAAIPTDGVMPRSPSNPWTTEAGGI